MIRKILGPEKFLIVVSMGVLIQFSSMLFATAIERTLIAAIGVIATIAIIVWIEDAVAEKSTYKNNMSCIILILVAIMGMGAFINRQQMTPATISQLITEAVFVLAIAEDTYFLR